MTAAVTISLGAHGGFELTVPSTLEGRTHVVLVPGDSSGLTIIRKVLSARAKAVSRLEIGNAASPTQSMVEAWLREERQRRAFEKLEEAEEKETKRQVAAKAAVAGIDLGDLDL